MSTNEPAGAHSHRLVLDTAQWVAFLDALERPVRHKPRLAKLLAEPTVLEQSFGTTGLSRR